MTRAARRGIAGLALAAAAAGCASVPKAPATPTPALPAYSAPVIPATLTVSTSVRSLHEGAWARLQAGDARGAARDYAECLRLMPGLYPCQAGLGFAALVGRDFKAAADRFRSVIAQDTRYVPAWRGMVDAELGAGRIDEAIVALEQLLALDHSQEGDQSRLELLRLKQLQLLVDSAGRAREAGRLDEADRLLTRALVIHPRSAIVLRELAITELRADERDKAAAHARQAIEAEPADAASHFILATILDLQGRLPESAVALGQAAALDPAYRERADAAKAKAEAAAVPEEMRNLGSQSTITRGQLAALIGTRLPHVLARNPRPLPAVATDVRVHWASPWILAVTQAGVMDVFANHTFQPTTIVRRADLAQAVSALLALAVVNRGDQLTRWRNSRPAFTDLDGANLLYPAAAMSVVAGAMIAPGGQFGPMRSATGADALAAIARIEELAGRDPR